MAYRTSMQSVNNQGFTEDEMRKINLIIQKYNKLFSNLITSKKLNSQIFSIFKPANLLIVTDKEKIAIIRSHSNTTTSNQAVHFRKRQDYQNISLEDSIKAAIDQLGFANISAITLPISLMLEHNEDEEKILESIVSNHFKLEFNEFLKRVNPLFVTENELEIFFEITDEDTFTELFVIPFLRLLGFEKIVQKGHKEKILEFGQDIKGMKLKLPTNHQLYFVAQIKVGTIGSSFKQPTQEIERLLTEIRPAFEKIIFDYEINRSIRPDHVLLIISGRIGEQARIYLNEQLEKDMKRRILLMEKEQLIEICKGKGLPYKTQMDIKSYIDEHSK